MSSKMVAKKWGPKGAPVILGSITSYKEDTIMNRRRLRQKLYVKYPDLDFYSIFNLNQKDEK